MKHSAESDNKYDRQLRLWGPEGQQKLQKSHILLINASATGSEALKSLVLPGIGQFTILDPHIVSQVDCANNFFTPPASLHQSRAKTVTENMTALNTDVRGHYVQNTLHKTIDSDTSFLSQFQLVIGTQLEESDILFIAAQCSSKAIPFLAVHTLGLLGYCRIQAESFAITDIRPDPPLYDLRLTNPFPSLITFANQFQLSELSSSEHAHVPYPVILLQAVQRWKQDHNGSLPSTASEKSQFKKMIEAMARKPSQENNFKEAVQYAYQAYNTTQLPENVENLCTFLAHSKKFLVTDTFWVLAHALDDFQVFHKGLLPHSGAVPDMAAATEHYIALQKIYRDKATEDTESLATFVRTRLRALKMDESCISMDEITIFSRRAHHIAVHDTRSIAEEYRNLDFSSLDFEEESSLQSPLIWYFLIRAYLSFLSTFTRRPEDMAEDCEWLLHCAQKLTQLNESWDQTDCNGSCSENASQIGSHITLNHAKEVVRFSNVEMHSTAALIGGVAAQEAVKVITQQFIPIDHTYVFNGIHGTAGTFKL